MGSIPMGGASRLEVSCPECCESPTLFVPLILSRIRHDFRQLRSDAQGELGRCLASLLLQLRGMHQPQT